MMNRCPKTWDALAPHPSSDFVRGCTVCKKVVRYCADLSDAAAWNGAPVVFDAALDRVAAHSAYRRREEPAGDDESDDDPDGYTVDAPPSTFRK